MDEAAWFEANRAMLEAAYLAASDPRAQSGFRGDAARWERGRRVIARAIDRDGTLLDVGCANGLLMTSLAEWAAADGHHIEPYGLDLSPALTALARARLPRWAGRIFVGNALTWEPPRRFDFVRTELVYVPEARQHDLVAHLLSRVVAPGGRLIICSYGSSRRPAPRAESIGPLLGSWGYPVAGEAEAADLNGVVITRIGWIDAAPGAGAARTGD